MVLMPYVWVFNKRATAELQKLPKEISARIVEKLDKSKIEPLRYFIKLTGRQDYKLKVGDYRVIADINQKELRIEVTKVGHRKNIYK